jgi:hypothetical protein
LALRCRAVAGRVFRTAILLLAGVSAALTAPLSYANVTYTYTGNNFAGFQYGDLPPGEYDKSMSVSGSFEVASAFEPNHGYNFKPLSYAFTDGRNRLTSASPAGSAYFEIFANASGQIDWWNIQLRDEPSTGNIRQIMTGSTAILSGQDSGVIQVSDPSVQFDTGWINSSPGSWTFTTAAPIPEPETYAMMMAGLGLLGFLARRRRQKEAVAA